MRAATLDAAGVSVARSLRQGQCDKLSATSSNPCGASSSTQGQWLGSSVAGALLRFSYKKRPPVQHRDCRLCSKQLTISAKAAHRQHRKPFTHHPVEHSYQQRPPPCTSGIARQLAARCLARWSTTGVRLELPSPADWLACQLLCGRPDMLWSLPSLAAVCARKSPRGLPVFAGGAWWTSMSHVAHAASSPPWPARVAAHWVDHAALGMPRSAVSRKDTVRHVRCRQRRRWKNSRMQPVDSKTAKMKTAEGEGQVRTSERWHLHGTICCPTHG